MVIARENRQSKSSCIDHSIDGSMSEPLKQLSTLHKLELLRIIEQSGLSV
jgi:hypothetical protein